MKKATGGTLMAIKGIKKKKKIAKVKEFIQHKKFCSLFCIPHILLLIPTGFQNKPQNNNEKKMTQRKTSEMMEGSGTEIFITGLNGSSNKKG